MSKKIVNVASVPQRSPFRYPGGKTWLVPHLRAWLRSLRRKPECFIEPFVGGGIIGLTVAFEDLAAHVFVVELDEDVAAVWKTLLDGNAAWLASRIVEFEVTHESVRAALSQTASSLRERAFQTILKNRVYHGGIMAHGSGLIKFGEKGKGLMSRWYPNTLKNRILNIGELKSKITFFQSDGMEVLRANAHRSDAVYFLDPPYTAAGKKAGARLYKYNELNHEELFRLTATLKGDFLMTYDNAKGVLDLAHRHGFDTEAISMKNTHHAKMTELLIGRNLDWFRSMIQSETEQPFLFPVSEKSTDPHSEKHPGT